MREHRRASRATSNGPPVQVRATSAGSELSRQVPVDLEADADLNEGRGSPRHCRPLAFPGGNKVDRDRPPRKRLRKHARSINVSGAQRRKKTGPLRVRFAVRRRGGRQSPSRGEQLTALRLQSGRMGNRLPPVATVCRRDFLTQRKGLHASHAAIVRRGGGAARRCAAS